MQYKSSVYDNYNKLDKDLTYFFMYVFLLFLLKPNLIFNILKTRSGKFDGKANSRLIINILRGDNVVFPVLNIKKAKH
jgi:hypothetical protein